MHVNITPGSLCAAPSHSRMDMRCRIRSFNGSRTSSTETTLYIGDVLEKVTIDGVTDWRHYIVADGERVAVVSRKSPASETTWYLLKDHLGSVAKILNGSGAEYVSESFGAFGARRDPATWSGPCPCPDLEKIKSVTRRGYTEHEMIGGQSMGLIHMNGRVQDSVTGRFLSADPIIQAPLNLQDLNRYSYAWNNPLTVTDPSGFLEGTKTCVSDGGSSRNRGFCFYSDSGPDLNPTGSGHHVISSLDVPRTGRMSPSTTSKPADSVLRDSTVGGRGTWGDFFGGMLRGIVDDWQQMGALYGHSQMMRAGQWDTAQLLLSAADEPLLG
ncbi:MAG TPA: RHS repeat-associated core domain-containing protein, partial [Nitrospiraceae bacterium]|nr:RHS repeat-associated core domain-containing protein [Nitrospiraceae bacterium]